MNPWWLAAGAAGYALSQVVRTRGWFNILRATYPDASELRARDVTGAYLAGVGVNSLLPARSGDFMKLLMIRRRVPSAQYSTLVGTLVSETLFEAVCGAALVGWALAYGLVPVPPAPSDLPQLDVSFVLVHPLLALLGITIAAIAGTLLVRRLRSSGRVLANRLCRGMAVLRRPRAFLFGVASWQALSRLIRLGALACLMVAFDLPLTVSTAVLVMAAQGAGRIVPLAPVSAGLRIGMLTYGLPQVAGTDVDLAGVTSFWFAVGAVHMITSVAMAMAALSVAFDTRSPQSAIAVAKSVLSKRRRRPPLSIDPVPGLELSESPASTTPLR